MQHALSFTVNLSYIQHKTFSIKDVKARTWSNHSKKLTNRDARTVFKMGDYSIVFTS